MPRSRRAGGALIVAILVSAIGVQGWTSTSAVGAPTTGSFTQTETITRDNLDNGADHVVDTRTVTLSVSQTQNLQGRQEISVSWTGAHPTGGIVADENSIDAQEEEYPMVLLECRGDDSAGAPASEAITPETCWTQDWSERYQDSISEAFPPYRVDRYATPADRTQTAGAPSTLPSGCFPAATQHWVPFIAASGQVYEDGPAGCAGQPPESDSVGGSALPSNETFGVTGLTGVGNAKFDVWTSVENASLGCTQTVACSLVAVPIMGVSCDVAAAGLPPADQPSGNQISQATTDCESTGNFAPGQLVASSQGGNALAVSGSLWWTESNWRNRIVVPLTFAPPANACAVVTNSHDVDIYGSELLGQATTQWAPYFCLNPALFTFTHVQTGEPEARNLVATGAAEAAFISQAPPNGYGKPVVNAPVAISGFAISYIIDGANGQPYTSLRLTPRLLAKLLTESYPAELSVQQEDPALAKNPLNITLDPEFQALNPGVTKGVAASDSAAALLTLSSDSDVISALTTYINDDPSARAWLNGKPDQWGMVVDPAYKNIKLPIDQWPLLSTFEPKHYYSQDLNDCLFHSPVPYLPLVAAPLATMPEISQALQFSIAQSTTACSQNDGTVLGEKLVPLGRQPTGFRFMIGVTSLADAARYELNTAALQTTPGTFVGPSDSSLVKAASYLKPNTTTGTWPVPYATYLSTKAASTSYPGTMVVYAAVPTRGLSAEDATDLSELLTFAAGVGQTPGSGVGQLPPGFLPMTNANGLGGLAAYTTSAAAAVAAQKGALPSLTASVPVSGNTGSTVVGPNAPTPSIPNPASSGSSQGGPPISNEATNGVPQPVSLVRTPGSTFTGAALLVVIVLGIALLCFGGPGIYLAGRRRGHW